LNHSNSPPKIINKNEVIIEKKYSDEEIKKQNEK
jgi:hypothetical protein